jgi:hypothetical protein
MSDAYFPWNDQDVYDFRPFDPTQSILAGMSTTALQAFLAQLQNALIQLTLGTSTAVASYDQGGGAKSITFRPTDIAGITQMIRLIQLQLGVIVRGRRAIRVRF